MGNLRLTVVTDGNTDVLLTATTPEYIRSLQVGSRPPEHIYVIKPIPYLKPGEQECAAWAEEMISEVPAERAHLISEQNKRLLRSVYLLASGNPGTLVRLLKELRKPHNWLYIVPFITGNASELLAKICTRFALLLIYPDHPLVHTEEGREIVLGASTKASREHDAMLQRGACFLHHEDYDAPGRRYVSAMTVPAVLNDVKQLHYTVQRRHRLSPTCRAFKVLFDPDKYTNISQLWERSVSVTIISASGRYQTDVNTVLGIKGAYYERLERPFMLHLAVNSTAQDLRWRRNTLIIPPAGQENPGFDSKLCCLVWGKQHTYYNIARVSMPAGNSTSNHTMLMRSYVQSLAHCLDDHLSQYTAARGDATRQQEVEIEAMSRMHVTFYQWGCDGNTADGKPLVSYKLARAAVRQLSFGEPSQPYKSAHIKAQVTLYIKRFWDENVRVLFQREVEEWLLPSLHPIPRFIRSVEGSDC